jgi:endogenous inhibitor of DNA gyrase (YacG/DUF329 family)
LEGFIVTQLQKERVTFMRGKGESYAKIAAALYISENTIKSFCRRNNLGKDLLDKKTHDGTKQIFCKQCGIEIQRTKKSQNKIFCSSPCRMEWWKTHPEFITQKAVYSFICHYCKNEFTAYGNKSRKFCSHDCYINARFGYGTAEAGVGCE